MRSPSCSLHRLRLYILYISTAWGLFACSGDPIQSGLDPFAPMVFKEEATKMPLNPPNSSTLQSFYVSPTTIFKFSIDTNSILIGADGVTRYIVVLTNPSGGQQAQYEGIRCDSYQWRLYGTLENNTWKENPLSTWRPIQNSIPNRYHASLVQGAFCDMNIQIKSTKNIVQSLNPQTFTGDTQNSNSNAVK